MYPLTLKPPSGSRSSAGLRPGDALSLSLRRRVAAKALVDFTRSFAVMISARLPVTQALETAAAQCGDRRLEVVLRAVKEDVQRGVSLSSSLARYPTAFAPFYVQLVRVGESAGVLSDVLLRLAAYQEKTSALKRKVRLALVYPSVVLSVALACLLFMLIAVVPTFADMFTDFGAALPAPTRIVLGVSRVLTAHFWMLAAGSVLSAMALRRWTRTRRGRHVWDAVLLRLPLVGPLVRKSLVARFCRTLATLLQGGVAFADALPLVGESCGNVHVRNVIQEMLQAVMRGQRLVQPLEHSRVFPGMVVQMLTVGEETAQLGPMLFHVADHYEQEVDATVDSLTSVIEPALIVLLGLILGSILVAMYMPMFELVNVVQ